ncbi:MAG: hypothetical protein OXH92_02275 [Bryobacterales bacterium]|nr:hypothetical protein [Bryobacterales bacterium]MDE0432813.1 hypothetical protein [Bryobacterales bacterium]
MQSVVAIGDNLPPDPQTITREFGRENLAARRALDDLGGLWKRLGHMPDARLKRQLWDQLLSLAYGAEQIGDDALFLRHTYLAVVAKVVVWAAMIDRLPCAAVDLLHGGAFARHLLMTVLRSNWRHWGPNCFTGNDRVFQFERRSDGEPMLTADFEVRDGDRYPIYPSEPPVGVCLSVRGDMLMQIGYKHDIDAVLFWAI